MTMFTTRKAAFAVSALTLGMATMTSQAFASTLNAMSVNQSAVNTTQLRIAFDDKPLLPQAYQQAGNNQLVLDFVGANNALPRDNPVNTGVINKVTTLNNGQVTRLIVDLHQNATYNYRVEGNELIIEVVDTMLSATPMPANSRIGNAAQTPNTEIVNVVVNPLLMPSNATSARANYEGIAAINYTPAGAGGTVTLALTNEAIPVDVQRQGKKIVVRTTGATIPRHLLRRLNTGGLVASIDADNKGGSGVLTINMSEDYEYQAYQTGAQVVISVKPAEMLREPTLEERVYTGEPLSMEFQDVPVRTVLDVIANFTGQNIVADDSVSGNITLRLVNVPWDQALDIILKSRNLDKRVNGNVILVAPAAALAEREAAELRAKNEIKDLEPLRTEYIRLNYIKAEPILTMIEKAATNSSSSNRVTDNSTTGLLSLRGSIIADSRSNTLIIKDTSESINNIRAMIEKIDIPLSQVMIEARIVTATDSFAKDLGVRWGVGHTGNDLTIGSSHVEGDEKKLNVDLGTALNPTGRLVFGLLNISDTILSLELQAMQAERRGEVIASPKVLTADKQTARISSGQQIPYQEASASGATSVSFKEAALTLEVTPNITPDGKIGLELSVKNGAPVLGGAAIKEDSIQTNVLLEDGQTIVLGGVFRNTVDNGVRKVPFLGDLPYVGRLFRNNARQNNKEELLIFVTPRIVHSDVNRID